jgi:peptidoglycan hydrolase CwlO-like protein
LIFINKFFFFCYYIETSFGRKDSAFSSPIDTTNEYQRQIREKDEQIRNLNNQLKDKDEQIQQMINELNK